jgi:LytS/YehU family sensor histidine kinase
MKCRLGDRLHVDLALPEELRDAPFPPLLLITLVENAIKHGAEPKPGATNVTLTARITGADFQSIEVLVEDDGAGLRMGMGEGTGLANIRAQLSARFGSTASVELSERAEGGARARLLVPLESRVA